MSRFSYPNSHLTKRSMSKNIAVNISITGLSDNDILKEIERQINERISRIVSQEKR